jgi:acyl carrier protein
MQDLAAEASERIDLGSVLTLLKEVRPEADYAPGLSLVESELLDSFDIITVVALAEERFGCRIPGGKILPENFETPEAIAALLQACRTR